MRVKLISSSTGPIVLYGLITGSLRMVVGATSVVYLTAHGVSLAQIGAMKAMQALLILLLDVPLSYLADRTSRVYVLVGGNVATALWLGTTAYSTSVPGFFLAEAFNAIGLAAFNGVFTAVLIDSYEKEYGRQDFENVLGWFGKWQFFLMAVAAAGGAVFYMGASPIVWWTASFGMILLTVLTPIFFAGHTVGAHNTFPLNDQGLNAGRAARRSTHPLHFVQHGQASTLLQAVRRNSRVLPLALALAGILLTFQVLLQFWQPVVEGAMAMSYDPGKLFGAAFVIFLLAQSLASQCVRRSASVTHGWPMRTCFLACIAMMCWMYSDLSVAFVIAAIAMAFFVVKGLSIVVLSNIQRVVPRENWSMTESAISSFTRLLFIATLPFVGAFGDRASAQGIFVVILLFMAGSFLCLALGSKRRPPY